MIGARYTETRRFFSLACRVEENIDAAPSVVWQLLTDAPGFPRWNSTVTSIEGEIREGQRLRLHVPGTDRTFTPRVSDVVSNERMTWTGGFAPLFKGVRSFRLRAGAGGSTDFEMEERPSCPISQAMFPGFVALAEHYTRRGVTFLAFSTDDRPAEIPGFLAHFQAPFQPLHMKRWAPGALVRDMSDVGLHISRSWTRPYVAVLDGSGRVIGEWDAARDLRAIDAALQTVQ